MRGFSFYFKYVILTLFIWGIVGIYAAFDWNYIQKDSPIIANIEDVPNLPIENKKREFILVNNICISGDGVYLEEDNTTKEFYFFGYDCNNIQTVPSIFIIRAVKETFSFGSLDKKLESLGFFESTSFQGSIKKNAVIEGKIKAEFSDMGKPIPENEDIYLITFEETPKIVLREKLIFGAAMGVTYTAIILLVLYSDGFLKKWFGKKEGS